MNIKDLTDWAKEFMLRDGKHGPMLFVETDAPELVIAGLMDMPGTSDERLPYFLALGRKFAADHPGRRVREVAFIAMSWASMQRPGQPAPKVRPSQDPKRLELLMVSHLVVTAEESVKLDGQFLEIIKGRGKTHPVYGIGMRAAKAALLIPYSL